MEKETFMWAYNTERPGGETSDRREFQLYTQERGNEGRLKQGCSQVGPSWVYAQLGLDPMTLGP